MSGTVMRTVVRRHAFNEMAQRVALLVRSQQERLANVSHELRTPLSRIRVALDLAAEGDAHVARESLTEINEDLAGISPEDLVRVSTPFLIADTEAPRCIRERDCGSERFAQHLLTIRRPRLETHGEKRTFTL